MKYHNIASINKYKEREITMKKKVVIGLTSIIVAAA